MEPSYGCLKLERDKKTSLIVKFFLALLLAEIANERLKILISLLFDLQTNLRGQNGVEFYYKSIWHVRFFLALLLAEKANDSE